MVFFEGLKINKVILVLTTMTKTHEPKKIIFAPQEIKIDYDESQRIWFVYLETEPFDYEDKIPVKNPNTGKLESKIEIRKYSHLRLTFNSQKQINHFSSSVRTGQFYEVETSWSSAGKSGRDGDRSFVEQVNINEENPQIKKNISDVNSSHNSNKGSGMSGGMIILLIVGMISVVGFFSWLIWKGKRTDAPPTIYRNRNRWG